MFSPSLEERRGEISNMGGAIDSIFNFGGGGEGLLSTTSWPDEDKIR